MSNSGIRILTVCLSPVLVLGLVLGLAACESLEPTATTMAPTTTETTVAPTTTTEAAPAVDVTMESGSSPCYVRDAFSQGGVDYVVVDYIQVNWNHYPPVISNTNPKLRTFVVPAQATVFIEGPGYLTFEELIAKVDVDPNGAGLPEGYWEITVQEGEVESLLPGQPPADMVGG